MRTALAMEWEKLRPVHKTSRTIALAIALAVTVSALVALAVASSASHMSSHDRLTFDSVGISLEGVNAAVLAVAAFGYEAGSSAPTLDVLRNLALALNTSADSLLFDAGERGPETPSLRLHLEALDQLDPDEQNTIRAVIEGALLRHQIRQVAVS